AFNLNEQQANVILRLRTIKGVESQFFLLSDIGEGALTLPLEPSFYWASTNNGDDNQLFAEVLAQCDGNFELALRHVVAIAPYGAKALQEHMLRESNAAENAGAEHTMNSTDHLFSNEV
ncbi:MAG: hypothetical protein ACO3XO_01625, partial [Bdellovibrionota bacterium]